MEGRFRDLVIEAFFPRFCVRCRAEGAVWCAGCESAYRPRRLSATCPFCAAPGSDRACEDCRPQTFLDGLLTLGSYADQALRATVTLWKYHGDRQAGEAAVRLVRRGAQDIAALRPDAAVPVPLHISRLRARGFDQAAVLARAAADAAAVPYAGPLRRRARGAPQARVTQDERLIGDLDGHFEAVAPVPKRVLLCDDVFTSGATMDAAAKALKEAGAQEVWGFALAKGRP